LASRQPTRADRGCSRKRMRESTCAARKRKKKEKRKKGPFISFVNTLRQSSTLHRRARTATFASPAVITLPTARPLRIPPGLCPQPVTKRLCPNAVAPPCPCEATVVRRYYSPSTKPTPSLQPTATRELGSGPARPNLARGR